MRKRVVGLGCLVGLVSLAAACASPDGDGSSAPDPRPFHSPRSTATPAASATPAVSPSPTPTVTVPTPAPDPTPIGTLTLIAELPHGGWSEGLDYHEGELWHAFPRSIRVYDPETGVELRRFDPPSTYSESLVWVDGRLWNVSYEDSNIYLGTPVAGGAELEWQIVGTTPEIHAWGIAFDGTSIIVTGNGSPYLYFLDPVTAAVTWILETPVDDLEDLAWHDGAIWASSYFEYSGQFFRIHPVTGEIVDVHSLPDPAACAIVDGIAIAHGKVYVTGKDCPSIYVFALPGE